MSDTGELLPFEWTEARIGKGGPIHLIPMSEKTRSKVIGKEEIVDAETGETKVIPIVEPLEEGEEWT